MVFPRPMAAVSRRLNPPVLPLTRQLPPLAVLHHKGRRSGSSCNTPVQAYQRPMGGWQHCRCGCWASTNSCSSKPPQ
jgi:hypothetical protein